MFEIMFHASLGEKESVVALLEIGTPLFRDILGGVPLMKILSVIAYGNKEDLLDYLPDIIRFTFLCIESSDFGKF